MKKIKTLKIKNEDGSINEESYTISADAINIDMKNKKNLQETIGNINVDEDGSIEEQLEILDKNIKRKRVYHFDNILKTRQANTLQDGDCIITKGYYEPNDGGAGIYLIREKTQGDNDNKGSIHFINNMLVAELIINNNTVNIRQFGARGDGITDDTDAIQRALDTKYKIIIPEGTFIIVRNFRTTTTENTQNWVFIHGVWIIENKIIGK